MRVNADEYRKFQKAPNFNDFSRDCYNLSAIEKQQEMKTFEQNCVTWSILQDFHFHTERQLFYLPIELTQVNLKVQTHTNAFLARIYGSCLAEYPSIRRENIDKQKFFT